ncbi:MAG TPA: thymidine phosphorylase [Polyangiaceae bacterium]|nr:thymidine phosphorylase [Polyangiaceae bacterium]
MRKSLVELLVAKRNGEKLVAGELRHLIDSFARGELTDYQMSAFAMAVYFQGLDDEETIELTQAMLESGDVLDLTAVPGVKVDKHSTGGVGDKVSLCLAPLVAACGVPVPMVAGRGLGHTGGTLDKLEAIPGFRIEQTPGDFTRILSEVGTALIGQTARIAPVDKRLYALRDVTGTVESIPLIVASILSKKLAEGIDALVLDVKVGRGAFMQDVERARQLARALVRVGSGFGKRVVALLTDMDTPLGTTVGNAIETREAIELLHGRSAGDLRECTWLLGAEMLRLAGRANDATQARALLDEALASGRALEVLERLVAAQGGDARVVRSPQLLALAPEQLSVRAQRDGWVSQLDARAVGLAAVELGAGRSRADQAVDPGVGIELCLKPGQQVRAGEELARVFARETARGERCVERVLGAYELADEAPPPRPLLLGRE